jgi:hypothetical protein
VAGEADHERPERNAAADDRTRIDFARPQGPPPSDVPGGTTVPTTWSLREPQGLLVGSVAGVEWNAGPLLLGHDGDWVIDVIPDQDHAWMAYNTKGRHNFFGSDGTDGDPIEGAIQCEIQPIDNSQEMFNKLLSGVGSTRLTVVGPFVEDGKHDDRTEIHPIDGMVFELRRDPNAYLYLVLAFSDASEVTSLPAGKTSPVWFAHTDRAVSLALAWPPVPADAGPGAQPVFRQVDFLPGRYRSVALDLGGGQGTPSLIVTAHTGTPDEGNGMFAAAYSLLWSLAPLTLAVDPSPRVVLMQPVTLTVTATSRSGDPVPAVIVFEGAEIGRAGTAFTYTFPWRTETDPITIGVDGKPHGGVRRVAPSLPIARAEGYADTPVPLQYAAPD